MSLPPRALDGVRVLDLTRFPPGAFCTVLLADLGAEIWHVEPPGSSPMMSGVGVGLGRGKRSISLDPRHEQYNTVIRRLAATCDVLVENSRPGDMDTRGFGYSHAAVELPNLIWCSITGYGQDGPYALWPGHDISYTAHSGALHALNPELPWHPQLVLSIPSGATMAAVAILAAMRERDRTGTGCQLDISLTEAATWLLTTDDGALNTSLRGIPVTPDRHLYQCSDGRWIATASGEPKPWRALCTGLGCDDLAETLWKWEDPQAVTDRFAAVFATRPAAEWVADLGARGAAIVAVNRSVELHEDPQVQARGTLQKVGDTFVPSNPIRFRGPDGARPTAPSSPPPEVGADTDGILAAAGLNAEEIARLRDAGAFG